MQRVFDKLRKQGANEYNRTEIYNRAPQIEEAINDHDFNR